MGGEMYLFSAPTLRSPTKLTLDTLAPTSYGSLAAGCILMRSPALYLPPKHACWFPGNAWSDMHAPARGGVALARNRDP
jgi:hypothetical protein